MIYWPTKTVAEVVDRGLDWSPALSELGDPLITDSAWEKLRGAADAAFGSVDADGKKVYTRVSGGEANAESVFRNTVTLSDGQVVQTDVFIKTRA